MNSKVKSRCVVVGYGSIGSRHARILQQLGCDVAIVSRRDSTNFKNFQNVLEAVGQYRPEYVVVANETELHRETLHQLAASGYNGVVLMEKPLFSSVGMVPLHNFKNIRVAYNLRFHPVITRLRELLSNQEVLSVQGYVGQYLPDWRPGVDYRNSYSASSDKGGGALLDLSHDLDYMIWMFGSWLRVTALGGQLSTLEVSSDDLFALLLVFDKCPVASIQLNYLDRRGRRSIVVNTVEHTYEADLIQNKIWIDNTSEVFSVERDDTYRAMHLAMLKDGGGICCTVAEAIAALSLIDATRLAAGEHR